MKATLKQNLLVFGLILFSFTSFSQEEAPLKVFNYSISLNALKTETQASNIRVNVTKIDGVKNCQLILTDYQLTFTCTNHDMKRYEVMSLVKAIIIAEGVEIVLINRTEEND